MLVRCIQARICRVQPFILEKTEYREGEEREDEDKTRELGNEDD
jgi:hypothetical protein